MRRGVFAVGVEVGLVASAGVGSAQGLQFSIAPENQPSDAASAETMRLYSGLNQRLADATEEPASSCLKSYAVYQGCKAGERPATCGAAPSCTVAAPLPAMDLAGIRINFPAGQDTAVLTPRAPWPTLRDVDMTKIKMIPKDSRPPVAADSGAGGVAGGGPVLQALDSGGSPQGPVRIAGGVISGVRISAEQPKYPPIAKIAHLSGTVVLRAIISKTGTIEHLEVAAATSPLFVLSSIDAVRHWVYKPYLLNGEPTEVDTTITVNYALAAPKPAAPSGAAPN